MRSGCFEKICATWAKSKFNEVERAKEGESGGLRHSMERA